MSHPLRVAVGRANQLKYRAPGSPEHLKAEQEKAHQTLRAAAARVVAEAPPLSDEQIDGIASILRGAQR